MLTFDILLMTQTMKRSVSAELKSVLNCHDISSFCLFHKTKDIDPCFLKKKRKVMQFEFKGPVL